VYTYLPVIKFRIILGGVIPFAVIFLNWHEFLTSVSKGEYMLSVDNTIMVSILLLIATSEITVVLIFLQLCAEDYHWWWQSFMIGASPALYMFG
jgi:transmembrane 9 superfamily protein 2/4